jgi:hypothetical protein
MDEKGNKTPKRDRYWSIMLVGDHGRVIPFRHFKALAIGICLVLILSLAALAGLGFFYRHQHHQLIALQKSLHQTDVQISKLRDEKDLCLTEMMAMKKQTGELSPALSADTTKAAPEKPQAAAKTEEKEKIDKTKISTSAPTPTPAKVAKTEVKWAAEIRNFKVTYDNRQQILRAEFRLYNTSIPKHALAGRTVLVFKHQEDAPINWAVVPSVPIRDGKPLGDNGKTFRINNFRTEHFAAYRRNGASEYDTASIFVFSEHGELIAHSEMPFQVDYTAPKPATHTEPKPHETPEKSPIPAAETSKSPADAQAPQTSGQVAPTPPGPQTVPQRDETITSEPPPQGEPANPDTLLNPDQPGQTQTDAEPEKSPAVIPAPAAEPKPAPEGGQK